MLLGTVAQADILTGFSILSSINNFNRPVYRTSEFDSYKNRGVERAFKRDAIKNYKVYDTLVSYPTQSNKKFTVTRKFVRPPPKENTVVSSLTKEVCDEAGQCVTTVTTITDRVKTEIIR